MVEIISKNNEPRAEDVRARNLIRQNSETITKLADQLSGGVYSANRRPKEEPRPDGLIIHVGSGTPVADEVRPHVRVSINGRVIAVDLNSGRQLHHIGQVFHRNGRDVFVVATKANGFFDPVETTIAKAVEDLDGKEIDPANFSEEHLAIEIASRLGVR